MTNHSIASFYDLEVYRESYNASIKVMNELLPKLPPAEKYDLKDQMSRASKAIPRLIAEGYAKRHQKMGFQKYLDDAMGECNEMIVCLSHCIDVYVKHFDKNLIEELIAIYNKTGRQLYKLSMAWTTFKKKINLTT